MFELYVGANNCQLSNIMDTDVHPNTTDKAIFKLQTFVQTSKLNNQLQIKEDFFIFYLSFVLVEMDS